MNGARIKAPARITKQGYVYTFDRATRKPVWPIEERPVPASDVPGEKASPTQPVPSRPAPFEYQGVSVDDLVNFTPELRALATKAIEPFKYGPLYTPPSVQGTITRPGSTGGGNWQGAAVDPVTGYLYVPSPNAYSVHKLSPPVAALGSNLLYMQTPGRNPQMPDGLPRFKPPYSRLTAIDMNSGACLDDASRQRRWRADDVPGERQTTCRDDGAGPDADGHPRTRGVRSALIVVQNGVSRSLRRLRPGRALSGQSVSGDPLIGLADNAEHGCVSEPIRPSTLTAVLISGPNNRGFVLNDQMANLVEFTRADALIPSQLDRRQPELALLSIAPNRLSMIQILNVSAMLARWTWPLTQDAEEENRVERRWPDQIARSDSEAGQNAHPLSRIVPSVQVRH